MTITKLSRRTLLRHAGATGLAVAATGALAACGYGKDTSTAGGTKTLNVSWWGDATRAGLYRNALDLFGKDHTDIKFASQFADLDPYLQRLATQAAAGSLPDVFWMRDTHVSRYAANSLKLDGLLGGTIKTDDIGDAAVADGRVGDGVYALPTHYVGQCTIVDDDALAKYKLTYPADPNWDDLAALMTEAAKAGGEGHWGSNDPTLGSTQRHFEAWVRQSGAELYTTQGKIGFGSDELGSWLAFWQTLRKAGAIPPAATEVEADTSNDTNVLVTNKAPMLWESSNHLGQWQGLTKHKLSMHSLPLRKDGSKDWWFFPPILIDISAKTGLSDVCAQLVNFFINSEPAANITMLNQGAPSSAKIREALIPNLKPTDAAFVEQINREMTYGRRPFPVRPKGNEQVNDALTRVSQAVAYGKQTVSAAVSDFLKQAPGYLTA